jgi:hypothetical protein
MECKFKFIRTSCVDEESGTHLIVFLLDDSKNRNLEEMLIIVALK